MPDKNSIKTIDANILTGYILQNESSERDHRNKILSISNHANKGNDEIRIFIYVR